MQVGRKGDVVRGVAASGDSPKPGRGGEGGDGEEGGDAGGEADGGGKEVRGGKEAVDGGQGESTTITWFLVNSA